MHICFSDLIVYVLSILNFSFLLTVNYYLIYTKVKTMSLFVIVYVVNELVDRNIRSFFVCNTSVSCGCLCLKQDDFQWVMHCIIMEFVKSFYKMKH